jgi:LysM repeat protein
MQTIRIIALPSLAAAVISCTPQNDYDTANPYGVPDGGHNTPVNPVYDTPPAYEDVTGAPPPADPGATPPAYPTVPPTAGNRIHVVVKGDYLGKIALKYNVPVASIKTANNMKNDTVVLGRKLIIPPR